jgi:hypothetical protein
MSDPSLKTGSGSQDPGWCQILPNSSSNQTQNPVVGPPRTEVTDLPYHNRATPTRSLSNPDIGPAAGSGHGSAESTSSSATLVSEVGCLRR